MPSELAHLLCDYEPSETRFDEMLEVDRTGRPAPRSVGSPRPHWNAFLQHLAKLSPEMLLRRNRFVQDALASDGVTYNVYADPDGTSRPWELDLLPFILPASEWRSIEAAVAQRARLLDRVLADLYGPQQLLAEGLLPPALVFGQRSFLWPMHGVIPQDGVFLHVYAADLARAPDGSWWILSDRTRGPSGAGYALQNRMTLSQAFPEVFRELHVERLAAFFSAMQDALHRMSPSAGEPPLVVLLTPGPYNETYFEHSFLARYLGFPLVEGQDLIVRGACVYLKTLRGLRRVHAILRRLDDDFCDPVELRADSALGVPGLLHAIRAGNVVVANALGSAVLETAAFAGFYPAISERLFGEQLLMPSIATWWCGEAPALEYVREHSRELVIKPAYPSMQFEPVFGHTLDESARQSLLQRISAQPHAYVAQEWTRLSSSPTWDGGSDTGRGRLLPRATTLRVFAVATPDGYVVMPGGLTRVAPRDGDVSSIQSGGSSKDTWMLAERPVTQVSLLRPRMRAADVTRSVVDIASRVGENLFWLGRYSERCEGLARLLRAALVRVTDPAPQSSAELESLRALCEQLEVFATSDADPDAAGSDADGPSAEPEANWIAAVVDPSIPGGLAANVLRLCSAANSVRERMSTDNWHVLHRLQQRLPGADASLATALETVDEIMLACVSLAGFAMDDMTRDESWQFLLLGRRIERLAHLSSVIAHVLSLPLPARNDALEWLLEAANSIVTFRARFRRAPELLPVLHLVVFDDTNPHAVAFGLRQLQSMVERVATELQVDLTHFGGDIPGPFAAALRGVSLAGFEPESGPVVETACAALAELLSQIEKAAYGLSDDLQRRFFSHAATPAPVGIESEAS